MSQQEIDRYAVIRRLTKHEIIGTHAADLLDLSVRTIWRLKAKVRDHGAPGLAHQNRGRPSNRGIPRAERTRIAKLLRAHYPDFGPTFAAEKLAERHGIHRDPKTIQAIMVAEGLWAPTVRHKTEHRAWRQRRASAGELVQFDGSYEDWFEDRGPRCCLLAAIDDATGEVLQAAFAAHEGVFPVFGFWEAYVTRHGVPRALYLDRFSTYQMTQKVAVENHDLKTQFERAMGELKSDLVFAHSPQAKGRVERLFGTLQDRLIKELRLARVSGPGAGNQFLQDQFLPAFNKQFSVAPASPANLHRPLTIGERTRLPAIFSRQEERTVRNDFTLAFKNQWYQITRSQRVTIFPGDLVIIEERADGAIRFRIRGRYLDTKPLPERPASGTHHPWVIAATQPMRV